MTTHGERKKSVKNFYLDGEATTITNEALNGQSGTTDIVTKHTLTEKNNEYQKVSLTKVSALPGPRHKVKVEMLKIPAWYIPTKTVDYEGGGFQVPESLRRHFGGLTLAAAVSAVISLLELITKQIFS